jgi:hypothetical protein
MPWPRRTPRRSSTATSVTILRAGSSSSLAEALNRIELHPHIYREVEPGIRKCQLKTFPYAVIFRDGMGIEILAVMHLRRQPGYWKGRA